MYAPLLGPFLAIRKIFTQQSIKICLFFNIYTLFLMSNAFVSNTRLKLASKQAKAKQHPETELLTEISKKVGVFVLIRLYD